MKILMILTLLFFGLNSQAKETKPTDTFDGCYLLSLVEAEKDYICLQNTNSEGINGSGVKLASIRGNRLEVHACLTSTSSSIDESGTFHFNVHGKTLLSIPKLNITNGTGTVNVDGLELEYKKTKDSEEILLKTINENCEF